MNLRRSLAFVLSLCLSMILSSCHFLSDCGRFHREIYFPDDPRILQGSWQGVVENYPAEGLNAELQLELAATYGSTGGYDVSGTLQLGEEASLPLAGYVTAGCFETYLQTSDLIGALEDGGGAIEAAFLSAPLPTELLATVGDGEDDWLWMVHARWFKQSPLGAGQLSGELSHSHLGLFTFSVERSSDN